MRVVLFENEGDHAVRIKTALESKADICVECVATEYEFTCRIESFRECPPAAFILDLIVDWTEPEIEVPAPLEVRRDGSNYAGARCFRLLACDPRTSPVPVIFYSGCRRSDLDAILEGSFHFLSKDYGDDRPLLDLVRRLCLV